MRPFEFSCPTRVLVGSGQLATLPRLVAEGARVQLVLGGGSARASGLFDQVRSALPGRDISEYWGIPPNPTIEDIVPLLDSVRANRPEVLIAIGGGSVLDATKFAAVAAPAEVDPWTIVTKNLKLLPQAKVGAIVTLAGTGSETNAVVAIGNRETRQKLVYINPALRPEFAILDPDFLKTLPTEQLAQGVADALVHTLEQYVTYSVNAPLQERLAEALVVTLLELGPVLVHGQPTADELSNFLWAACLAQSGLLSTGVPEDWATHFIGHELTAHFGLAHARTLTLLLPHLYRLKLDKKADRLAQLGARVWGLSGPTEAIALQTVERLEKFFQDLGLPTDLSSVGLNEESLGKILQGLKSARRIRLGERMDITLADVEALLRRQCNLPKPN